MKKILASIVISFGLLSCGGGGGSSSSTPSIDNSVLANGENQYGYYGKLVEVGGEPITNIWLVYSMDWEELGDCYFYENGTYKTSYESGDFGVSKDGKYIYTAYDTVTLTSVESGTYSIINNGVEEARNCLIINVGNENARLCPFR